MLQNLGDERNTLDIQLNSTLQERSALNANLYTKHIEVKLTRKTIVLIQR